MGIGWGGIGTGRCGDWECSTFSFKTVSCVCLQASFDSVMSTTFLW